MFNLGMRKVRYVAKDIVLVRFRWWRCRRYWRLHWSDQWRPVRIAAGFMTKDGTPEWPTNL